VHQHDANKLAAQQRYTGKVVQTTARIVNISSVMGQVYIALEPAHDDTLTVTSISCNFDSQTPLLSLAKGQQVTVRGTMQDMSLTDISMEHCALMGREPELSLQSEDDGRFSTTIVLATFVARTITRPACACCA
jgi:hypothetical protein